MKCISGSTSGLLLDLLYMAYESTFGLYGSLYHFMLAWIVLFDPPLYMGIAILRGAQSVLVCYFGEGHKSVWAGNKSAWAGTQVVQPFF